MIPPQSNQKQISEWIHSYYNLHRMDVSNFQLDTESQDYFACQFLLDGKKILFRQAKKTPKKIGQFVTLWKRERQGPIQPFDHSDNFDLTVIFVETGEQIGHFVFPKSALLKQDILSHQNKEGKRAFRVYAPWDDCTSQQAIRTQKWQSAYFYNDSEDVNNTKLKNLYLQV